jgi:FkbH-like protein
MKTFFEIKQKMNEFKISDYFYYLKYIQENFDLSSQRNLKIAILRSYTGEMVEPILKLNLLLEGYSAQFLWGDYNQFSQEILDKSSSLYKYHPDIIILMIRIEEVMPQFVYNFADKKEIEWEKDIEQVSKHLINLINTINNRTSSQVIMQNMSLSKIPYWGIYDSQRFHNQVRLVQKLNQKLARSFEANPNSFIWDFNNFVARKGADNIYDPKAWYVSSNPFRQAAYIDISNDLIRYMMSALGEGKKCIVLDLDNTLWGGIIGEDGMEGIALGHNYPGNCYVDFQRELLKLYHRGIILALNSKNNETDAFEVIDRHPDMVLRRKHFAAYQINWNDKASNLKLLAKELNIGVDSMIMIDDNPAECNLIRQLCPQCLCIQLPERRYLIPSVLSGIPEIENIRLTEEDRNKGKIYQEQAERKNFEKMASNLDEYLKALNISIEIKRAEKFSIPRISQLTQKTNQFNMTTRRYTESEIMELIESPSCYVHSISSVDRFGDNGIVGVIINKVNGDTLVIDTFLLSCRVIGRTIEQSIVAFIAELAKQKGATKLIGEFRPTAKNAPAADFYEKMNFIRRADGNFIADLENKSFEYSPYIANNINENWGEQ